MSSQNSFSMTFKIHWSYHVGIVLLSPELVWHNNSKYKRIGRSHYLWSPLPQWRLWNEEWDLFSRATSVMSRGNWLYSHAVALTVRWLSKSWGVAHPRCKDFSVGTSLTQLIVCTGERMETLVSKLYRPQGIATTTFQPVHEKGLSNEFHCYANFECADWKWKT